MGNFCMVFNAKLLSECSRIMRVNHKFILNAKNAIVTFPRKWLSSRSSTDVPHYVHVSSNNLQVLSVAVKDTIVHEDFISEEEEESMLKELEPYMKRLRYESSHWDDAIHGYRETEKASWNVENRKIIDRVRNLAFMREDKQLKHVHVLDISAEGYIKPHVDSIKFCGDTIAGVSLLSSSIMRLINTDNKEQTFDILLKRRSLYIMK
ncbi:hypothetical protein CHUAL_011615 [Chamberlinius hualienensis]